jgi:hypothetical protein
MFVGHQRMDNPQRVVEFHNSIVISSPLFLSIHQRCPTDSSSTICRHDVIRWSARPTHKVQPMSQFP